MEGCEETAKLVETTYQNVIEQLGPCIKQLVVAGRTYLKSIYGMVAANRNFCDALEKIATLADNSALRASNDMGAALHHLADINREFRAQQSNLMKSLEFDFLEPMEIAADKDIKLIGREQKRFSQLHKGRREAFDKSFSTLKKSKRKKMINADKQLAQLKLMESSKTRLQEFCDESLKEVIVQERVMYGTILERQCVFNKQLLIYHNKGCELLQDTIKHWEGLAETRNELPYGCLPPKTGTPKESEFQFFSIEGAYQHMDSPNDIPTGSYRSPVRVRQRECVDMTMPRMPSTNGNRDSIYARPIVRAKSEYSLPTASSVSNRNPAFRPSTNVEHNSEHRKSFVRAIYPYEDPGEYKLQMSGGDIIEFTGKKSATGWQFGDNMMTKRSGWFPLSYTESLNNTDDSPTSSRSSTIVGEGDEDNLSFQITSVPPQPFLPIGYQSETSDYGTLRKSSPKKPLAVDPPMVPSHEPPTYQEYRQRSSYYLRQTEPSHNFRDLDSMPIGANASLQGVHL